MIKPALWSFVLPALLSAQLPSRAELLDSARGRLAQLDGTITVSGLDSVVEVRRDRWGVPHIYAKTQQDLFFAQGFVAAQDRLWQMEMWRRIGEGRLAEVVGPGAVERDRIARLLAYRDRKSTRLNSSHTVISYAVFCLKKKTGDSSPTAGQPSAHPGR